MAGERHAAEPIMSKIIISFGCPRSGTTFMWTATRALAADALVLRIPETQKSHPVRSRSGLLDLVKALIFPSRSMHQVLLIRTVRHPLDIVESFLAARLPNAPKGLSSQAQALDSTIRKYIQEESASWAVQRPRLLAQEPDKLPRQGKKNNIEVLEARYDREAIAALWDPVSRFLGPGADRSLEAFRAALGTFNKKPVRAGRLGLGLGRISTPEERDYWTNELAEVIEREGYSGQEPPGDKRI